MARVLPASVAACTEAAGCLRDGGIVVFPTETVYGVGVDIRRLDAARRLLAAKELDPGHPLMAHCSDTGQLARLVSDVSIPARRLIHRFWPGPLALVLHRLPSIPPEVTGGSGCLGIRMVADRFTAALISELGAPIAGTSANLHAAPAAGDFARLSRTLLDRVDIAIDSGPAGSGQASTVLDMTTAPPRLIRAGMVPVEEIEALLRAPISRF
jgi:L-threonylcarbamoyladenylate synthase